MHTGRQTPVFAPASAPVGITQLRPAAQPKQPVSPLQPEFCVHEAPTLPRPGQAQSVVSVEYTKQANPVVHRLFVATVGSQGREHAAKCAELPHWMGTLQ